MNRLKCVVLISAALVGASALPPLTARAQQLPQTVYIWPMGTASQNVMMASLAGIVNRNTNGELLISPNVGTQPNPRFWLDQLQAAYPQVQSQVQSNASTLIARYRSMLNGYVLYDRAANPDSINVATSIAGVTNSLAVDSSTRLVAQLAGLPMVADARNMTYAQAYQQYGSQFNREKLFHQDAGKNELLRDYAIMNRGFMFYSDSTTLTPYAAEQDPHGRIYGWGPSEVDLFAKASRSNQQVVASDYSWSSSTTARWQVPLEKQQWHPPANVATQAGKHYVAFVMSDGDNAQWLSNGFATDPKWFGSPHRGNFNMSWDMTGSLPEMNPVAFNYLYQHASNGQYKDSFVSTGLGLTFPSQYPDATGLAESIGDAMEQVDQRVVSILDTSYDRNKLSTILDDPQVTGMMFKTYDNHYKGRNGAIEFVNGKPIVSVKYSLWDGADTAASIANSLNNSSHRDPINNAASYSIVNVHPWSTAGPTGTGTGDPMSNLNQLVQWLDPAKVEVVTLEELMVQLRNNFGAPMAEPGDFNGDGSVDGDDLAAWKRHFGVSSGATFSQGDANGDGAVDGNDFLIWQRYFDGVAESSVFSLTVPEPADASLFVMAAIAACRWRAASEKRVRGRRHPRIAAG